MAQASQRSSPGGDEGEAGTDLVRAEAWGHCRGEAQRFPRGCGVENGWAEAVCGASHGSGRLCEPVGRALLYHLCFRSIFLPGCVTECSRQQGAQAVWDRTHQPGQSNGHEAKVCMGEQCVEGSLSCRYSGPLEGTEQAGH